MNTPQPMNMRDGTVVSEKMEPVVPALVCRDLKVTKRRFSPSNGGTFTSAGSEIRIPISGNFVLDNKNLNLNFNVNTTATGNGSASVPGSIDFSPAGFFSQIRVEAGTGSSIVLESIDDPAVWANMLYQYTWTHEDMAVQSCKQRSSINQPGPARFAVTAQVGAAGPPPVAAQNAIAAQEAGLLDKTGAPLSSSDIDVALDLSLFMGLFSGSSGIPLYDTAGLTLVLTLNTAANAYVTNVADTASVFTISQVFVTASCLEGGEGYEKKLKELKNSGNKEISIMYNTCRRYIQSQAATAIAAPGAQTQGNYLVNERSKSCLGFVAIARDTTNNTKTGAFSNSNSSFPTAVGVAAPIYQYNIAGMSYPISSISTKAEAIDEAYDLYSQLSRRHDSGGLLSRTQAGGSFVTAITSDTTQLAANSAPTGPAQVLAINLSKCGPNENYWGKGMNMSGNNLSTYLQVQYAPYQAQTINIYSIFQMKLHIDALGNMSTEF